jgi:peptide/nickel transport system substrate-binding protein
VALAGACGSSSSPKQSSSPGTGTGSTTTAPSGSAASAAVPADVNTYNPSPSGTKVPGGTVYWAEAPSATPNYIFPMTSFQVCSVANTSDFSSMMYRPLYWFGNDNTAKVDYNYSIGQAPVFSNNDQTVTINLNNYKWSDGETVTSYDVALWISIYKSDPSANYCGYVPPASNGEKFFPDNIKSMSTPSPTQIVFQLTQSYNPTWFQYNELSQITPLPAAWDTTTSTPAPVTALNANQGQLTMAQAAAVYTNLDKQSKSVTTWASSKLWAVVDGPFKLTAATATGEVDLVPNPDYSGPDKPSISKFVEVPFTDNNAEFTAVTAEGTNDVTVGYLPPEDSKQLSASEAKGYSPQSSYTLSYNYFPLNLNNPNVGPVFQQTYFRQAFEHLIDKKGWTTAFLKGWAVNSDGPIPTQPPNSFTDSEEANDPFPFSVSAASSLLSSHGWTVKPGGATTCTSPGTGPTDCGAGIPAGKTISFNLDYATGTPSTQDEMQQLAAVAAQVGIKISLTTHNFDDVISAAVPCKSTQSSCSWTAENWGAGWIYSPDFDPTGESLFSTGAAANVENYSNPTTDNLILTTTTASAAQEQSALDAYQNNIITQVPVVFEPTSFGDPIAGGPALIDSKLGGVVPNTYDYITPEQWYFTS